MRENVWERAEIFGGYIVENKATVRATAAKFNISKSTVHKDVSDRLKKVDPVLYLKAKSETPAEFPKFVLALLRRESEVLV